MIWTFNKDELDDMPNFQSFRICNENWWKLWTTKDLQRFSFFKSNKNTNALFERFFIHYQWSILSICLNYSVELLIWFLEIIDRKLQINGDKNLFGFQCLFSTNKKLFDTIKYGLVIELDSFLSLYFTKT